MRTMVITGGTDGMGAALTRHYLAAGDQVVVVGRSVAKFDALVAKATGQTRAHSRAVFVQADLSLVSESRHAIEEIALACNRIDGLILAASFIRQHRVQTTEGHEASWALFFLSKYLFVHGLADLLRAAEHPVIVNTAVPGAAPDALNFMDLELADNFSLTRSNAQQRRANELLGILATRRDPRISYVTWGPSRLVRTSLAGEVGIIMKIAASTLGLLLGQQPDDAVQPVIRLLDSPSPGRSAYRGSRRMPLSISGTDENDASRLDLAVTEAL